MIKDVSSTIFKLNREKDEQKQGALTNSVSVNLYCEESLVDRDEEDDKM